MSKVKLISKSYFHQNFGLQWNKFKTTQLDSHTGLPLSEKRLERIMGNNWEKNLSGKKVIEIGCGAGRFSEIIAKHADHLTCIDASSAIYACEANLKSFNNVSFVLSTIEDFPETKFDIVFCVGVLQHTKNYKSDLRRLTNLLTSDGVIYLDFYRRKWKNYWPPIGGAGNIFRLLIKGLKPERSYSITEKVVNKFFPIHWKFKDSRVAQHVLFRISPVRFYYPWLGLESYDAYYEWALLDTYDGSTDRYKHRTTLKKFKKLLNLMPLKNIECWEGGNGVEARAKKL